MHSQPTRKPPRADDPRDLAAVVDALDRLLRRVERIERRFDDFAAVYLRARFPFGRAVDRWAGR